MTPGFWTLTPSAKISCLLTVTSGDGDSHTPSSEGTVAMGQVAKDS
jgi:hypothetical protein